MKKILFMAAALLILPSRSVLAQVADVTHSTAGVGDAVHCDESSAVYYIGEDGQRYVFPNENIYLSWHRDFNDVIEVSCNDLWALPLGGAATYQAGSALIKLQSDPSVYAVEDNGVLREIEDEDQARALYGDDWAKQVDDISDAFFPHYELGEPLQDGELPDGMIAVNDAGDVYRSHDGVFVEVDELVSVQKGEDLSEISEDLEDVEERIRTKFSIEIEAEQFDETIITALLADLMRMFVLIDVPEGQEVEIEIESEDIKESDDHEDEDEDADGLVDAWEVKWKLEEETRDAEDDNDDSEDADRGSDDTSELDDSSSGHSDAEDEDVSNDSSNESGDDTSEDTGEDNSGSGNGDDAEED